MTKIITLELSLDDDEYEEFLNRDEVQGHIDDFFFGLLSQDYDCGFLSRINVRHEED